MGKKIIRLSMTMTKWGTNEEVALLNTAHGC